MSPFRSSVNTVYDAMRYLESKKDVFLKDINGLFRCEIVVPVPAFSRLSV